MSDIDARSRPAGGRLAGSTAWRIRKPIHFGMGLAMVLGLLAAFWPLHLASSQMRRFCAELAIGATMDEAQAKAAAHGYEISPGDEGQALVSDPRSLGRRTCTLRFGTSGLLVAE